MRFVIRVRPLLLAVLLLLSGCKVALYSKLSETEAMEIMALLMRHGIDAGRIVAKDGSNTLEVDKDRLADAVDLLRSKQLPRQKFATMGEVFQQQGLIASPTEERARFIYALSQELSHTLSQIDGVLSARVHVVLPHNDPLRQEVEPAAAAVFLRHDVATAVDEILPQVKLLVANSIQGLSYDKVTVVLLPVPTPAQLEGLGLVGPTQAGLLGVPLIEAVPNGLLLGAVGALTIVLGGGAVLLRRSRRATGTAVAVTTAPEPVRTAPTPMKEAA